MTPPESNNPFASPTDPRESKVTPEEVMRSVRIGWIMPIVSGLGVGQYAMIAGFEFSLAVLVVVLLTSGLSLLVGIRFTLRAFTLRRYNPHVGPQIGWAIVGNLLMAVLFVACTIRLFNVDWSDFSNAIY
ncbi:hypothetical protein DTL42_01045 [Bremerella cremea]|uniref:Uncharacterized protein n=1 Tax=Bremerella cremea TaxID=1031537 RepID=A0A368KZR1_9BACT|nr:hypothetical protein [Bremerella cremea]RCS56004.1 hypothetical protein DTL42_01045 [Bremerella cremea]